MSDLSELSDKLNQFAIDRDWNQFHTPKNLAMALSAETGELLEIFQWLSPDESAALSEDKHQHVREELADIFLYTLRLSPKLDIDLIAAANEKMESNALKYPSDKVRGSAKKYNEYE